MELHETKSDAKKRPMVKWTVIRSMGGPTPFIVRPADHIKMIFYCKKGHPPPEFIGIEIIGKSLPYPGDAEDACPLSYRLERNSHLVLPEYASVPKDIKSTGRYI